MNDLGMYCLCYAGSGPKLTQYNQKNIMCGAINYHPVDVKHMIEQNFVMDYTGNNISQLNTDYGSLTGIYWVWKNAQHQYKGTNTYRLFWDEKFELAPNRIYVPKPIDVLSAVRGILPRPDIITHFNFCHDPAGMSWKLLKELANSGQIPIRTTQIDQLDQHRFLIPYHMFTADNLVFDKLCSLLFEILFRFYERYQGAVQSLYQETNQIRFYDFFGERILHLILANIYYFFGNVDVRHLNLKTFDHKA